MALCTYLWENILDPTMAEVRACLNMVSFVEELGFRDVCVEGDALIVIRKYDYPMYWVEKVPREVERLVDNDRRGVRLSCFEVS
ncbi:hypothetical protein PVK06_020347 [Gossypium arboreum]|uniref:Uncharacterized protein n=1 Tax=Gossypium arboreum TaxID=29729 RepID=A0ABR0PMK7_GOSAR|nr:hypothetical protein PVK06_020347 [Gossypium arboreum]